MGREFEAIPSRGSSLDAEESGARGREGVYVRVVCVCVCVFVFVRRAAALRIVLCHARNSYVCCAGMRLCFFVFFLRRSGGVAYFDERVILCVLRGTSVRYEVVGSIYYTDDSFIIMFMGRRQTTHSPLAPTDVHAGGGVEYFFSCSVDAK